MTTKFTPGPWHTIKAVQTTTHDIFTQDHRPLASIYGGSVMGVPEQEVPANANLIAAAPEMYEALKEIDAQINEISPHHRTTLELAIQGKVRAAIAKADGRTA